MRIRCSDFFCLVVLVFWAVPAARGEVLAHGSPDSYWLAATRAETEGKVQTLVQYRAINSSVSWRTIAAINSRIQGLTHFGRDGVVLLDDGEWMILRSGSSSQGVLPTDGSRLIGLSGDADTLWAVAEARVGRRPTTTGATQPAASMEAHTRLLYRLERGDWQFHARLPNVAQDALDLSLGSSDRSLILAALLGDGRIDAFRYNEEARGWVSLGTVRVAPETRRIKVLASLGRPTVWAAPPDAAGVLAWRDDQWSQPLPLATPGGTVTGPVADVTVAGRNSIRLLVESEEKIAEYAYDSSGRIQGEPVTITAPSPPTAPEEFDWLTGIAAAALLIVLMNTMQRREPVTPETLTDSGVVLAPFGRRCLGGLIDALPVVGTLGVFIARGDLTSTDQLEARETLTVPTYISMAIYILLTLFCEMRWGWSIGKRIVGLRVVMIDGSTPTTRAIILRNLMRVLDVMMLFVPLLIVLLSPLRQRVGDIVGETIVVKDGPGATKAPEEPGS